ncbi:MAG: DUF2945 domain-containing protein [Pseudomonadota bacterium]
MSDITLGDRVSWNWGNGTGSGEVRERFEEDVTRVLKGTEVTRTASAACPAFLIVQEDGDEVLKSASELTKS